MASTGETEADLEAILRVGLLRIRSQRRSRLAMPDPGATEVLAAFQKAFHARWKHYTTCGAGYVMEDCSQSKK